jgi:polar amino acid transport system permease protein
MQRSRFRPLRWIVRGYIELFRNTPKLVQLYCFYFGVSAFLPRMDDGTGLMAPIIGAFTWMLLAFALHYGAFTIEVFRSGIEAVPETTLEASRALGMTNLQVYRLVLLPLAFRICLPALNNNYVFVVKGTSLAYAVGVHEMLYAANQIYTLDANVPEMMTLLLICYVSMVTIFVTFMNKLERALKMPGYGT